MGGPTVPYLPTSGDFIFVIFFAIFAVESFVLLQAERAQTQGGCAIPTIPTACPGKPTPTTGSAGGSLDCDWQFICTAFRLRFARCSTCAKRKHEVLKAT